MNLIPPAKEVKKFLIIFYIIGLIGFALPITQKIFIKLIPWALLLNAFLIVYFHEPKNLTHLLLLFIIAFLGFAIEVFGVKTGLLFGVYSYGKVLGIKLFDVPLIIGVNWLILSYGFTLLTAKFIGWVGLRVFVTALLITLFDVVMEPVAVFTGMWNWQHGTIPIQNYVMWFVVSLVFAALLQTKKKSTRNPIAPLLILLQFLFFLVLNLIIHFL